MKNYIIFILSLILLSSCAEDPGAYKVEEELDIYAQRFFTYAKDYGYNFDDKGLIMRFSNLGGHRAGTCYINKIPIEIEIDSLYWKGLTKSYLANDRKELVVFHEMGHGFLRRNHFNNVLKNSDWQSMMCGGELPNNRGSNINYRGMRKEYYIKELFTQTTEAPEWSTFIPNFSGMFQHLLYQLDIKNPQFPLIKQDNFYSRIENGEFVATSYKGNHALPFSGLVNTLENFCVEANIKVVPNEANVKALVGMFFGEPDTDKKDANIHYISLDGEQHILVGETICGFPFLDIYNAGYNLSDYTKIKIYKQGEFVYYYINDTFVYNNDISDLVRAGEETGLMLYAGNTVYVKDFKIYLDTPSNRSYKKMVPQLYEIEKPDIDNREF